MTEKARRAGRREKASVSQIFTRVVKLDASEMRLSFRMAARRQVAQHCWVRGAHTQFVLYSWIALKITGMHQNESKQTKNNWGWNRTGRSAWLVEKMFFCLKWSGWDLWNSPQLMFGQVDARRQILKRKTPLGAFKPPLRRAALLSPLATQSYK